VRRYAIYLLLFLLSLAVFGCTGLPQLSSSGSIFPASLQQLVNASTGTAASPFQTEALDGRLLAIAPEAVRVRMPETVRLFRNQDGTIQVQNGEFLSVSRLIPEFPRCTVDPDELSALTLMVSRSGQSGLDRPPVR